ncbi:MAG: DUF4886 domain-containing protein, partial [Clostridia bacterium]|nr:DUF4886 domain-containing protein [Clostridia bacterium]
TTEQQPSSSTEAADDTATKTTDATTTQDTTTTSAEVTTTTTAVSTTEKSTVADKTTVKTTEATKKTTTSVADKTTTTTTTTKVAPPTPGPDATTSTTAATTTTTAKTTTSRTKKTVSVKTTVTTTTVSEEVKSIKILAVGNSFSVDAMKHHLWNVLASAGYQEIVLGNLYIGGCSLNTHWNNARQLSAAYTYYSNTSGSWKTADNVDILRGISNGTQWDIITVQQASPDSGKPDSYSNLSNLVNWIKEKQPKAKVYFHMTWAYQQDSTHSAFPSYNSDQMTMYNAICSTVQAKVTGVNGIVGVIPCGTTIQNLRTSSLGDTVTADGYHLKDSYGDYAAALTWYCSLTGGSPNDVSYRPPSIEDHFDEIAESVENAIANPYKVIPCT